MEHGVAYGGGDKSRTQLVGCDTNDTRKISSSLTLDLQLMEAENSAE